MLAIQWARDRDACKEAVEWLETLPADATMADAWRRCMRSDWMLWALDMAGYRDDRALRLFAVSCAMRALMAERKAGREPDPRSWDALRVARRYARGKASAEDLRAARAAAWAAARAAAWDARAAAWAARAAAEDAAWDARAAWAAARAAAEDAGAAARAKQADSLRRLIPEWPGGSNE